MSPIKIRSTLTAGATRRRVPGMKETQPDAHPQYSRVVTFLTTTLNIVASTSRAALTLWRLIEYLTTVL